MPSRSRHDSTHDRGAVGLLSVREEQLAGILTVPEKPNGRTVLIPWGTNNRAIVRNKRGESAFGAHCRRRGLPRLPFRLAGSWRERRQLSRREMSSPLIEELEAASTWLASQGLDRIVIVANCFGGWSLDGGSETGRT